MNEAAHIDSRIARLSDVTLTPLLMPLVITRPRAERRSPATRAALVQRVCNEYSEMPGTSLTLEQAARLFGLQTEICQRVLGELIREKKVNLTSDSRYRLTSAA